MHARRTIFLFGFGSYGRQLYKFLHQRGHSVTIVTASWDGAPAEIPPSAKVETIDFRKDSALHSLEIDPSRDLLYCALTDRLENLFLVLSLRTLFPAGHIIAFSSNRENSRKLQYAGASHVISMYESSANHMIHTLTKPAVSKAIEEIIYQNNDLNVTEIELPNNSAYIGRYISQLDLKKEGVILLAIIDHDSGSTMLLTDKVIDHKLQPMDKLIVIGREEDLKHLEEKIISSR